MTEFVDAFEATDKTTEADCAELRDRINDMIAIVEGKEPCPELPNRWVTIYQLYKVIRPRIVGDSEQGTSLHSVSKPM